MAGLQRSQTATGAHDPHHTRTLEYLKQKGYTQALETMKFEASLKEKAAQERALDGAPVKLNILHHAEEDPKLYSEQYSMLRQFVSGSSLDVYKMELEQVRLYIYKKDNI